MVQDSIQTINDSVKVTLHAVAKVDSLARADSIAKADSLAHVDSLRTAMIQAAHMKPTGYTGIPHPVLPQTEAWVFIALLLLFGYMIYSVTRASNLLSDSIKNFFAVKERSSIFNKSTVNDDRFRIFLTGFSAMVLSLFAYLVLSRPLIDGFSLIHFSRILLITILFFTFKSLEFSVIGYVFLDEKRYKIASESYFNVLSYLSIILYPLLVILIYAPASWYNFFFYLSFFIIVLSFVLIVIKIFQIFFRNLVSVFYILLYLCTLEILPLFILYKVYGYFV